VLLPPTAKTISFIITSDREKARGFYGGVLGFEQVSEDNFALVYDMNGTILRISTVKDHQAQPHTILGWDVPDIVATVKALKAKGVTFNVYEGFGQDDLGIWAAPGSTNKVAWFLDPDGNNLSLTQF
jgi:catechol 2,3-dioxygenase-like lactoylglutathione lyase family enzyme